MDVRDLGGALWRQKLLVLVILAITAGAVGVGVLVAPTTYADPLVGDRPDRPLTIGVGAGIALLLAVGTALLRDRRTTTVDDGAVAESATSSPLLAHVATPRDATSLPALHPGTAGADVFTRLRVALESEARRHPVGRLVVAGVSTGEVNVWLGANLAVALAAEGRRVLLVDGRLGDRFGARPDDEPDTPGLYDVLAGGSLDRALSPGPAPGLMVLPSGAWGVSAPQALLEDRFAEVMAQVQGRFDVVVVLAPALDLSDDARLMAAGGSLLLAVPEGGITAAALRAHADRVRSVGARLLGVVLVGRHLEPVPA